MASEVTSRRARAPHLRLPWLALGVALALSLAGCSSGSSDLEDLFDRDQQPEDEYTPEGSSIEVDPEATRFVGEFVGEGDPVTFYALRWEDRDGSCLIIEGLDSGPVMGCGGTIGGVSVGSGVSSAHLLAPGSEVEDLDGTWTAVSDYVAITGVWE